MSGRRSRSATGKSRYKHRNYNNRTNNTYIPSSQETTTPHTDNIKHVTQVLIQCNLPVLPRELVKKWLSPYINVEEEHFAVIGHLLWQRTDEYIIDKWKEAILEAGISTTKFLNMLYEKNAVGTSKSSFLGYINFGMDHSPNTKKEDQHAKAIIIAWFIIPWINVDFNIHRFVEVIPKIFYTDQYGWCMKELRHMSPPKLLGTIILANKGKDDSEKNHPLRYSDEFVNNLSIPEGDDSSTSPDQNIDSDIDEEVLSNCSTQTMDSLTMSRDIDTLITSEDDMMPPILPHQVEDNSMFSSDIIWSVLGIDRSIINYSRKIDMEPNREEIQDINVLSDSSNRTTPDSARGISCSPSPRTSPTGDRSSTNKTTVDGGSNAMRATSPEFKPGQKKYVLSTPNIDVNNSDTSQNRTLDYSKLFPSVPAIIHQPVPLYPVTQSKSPYRPPVQYVYYPYIKEESTGKLYKFGTKSYSNVELATDDINMRTLEIGFTWIVLSSVINVQAGSFSDYMDRICTLRGNAQAVPPFQNIRLVHVKNT